MTHPKWCIVQQDNGQNILNNSDCYYLNPDKKITTNWEKLTGLQLPVVLSNNGYTNNIPNLPKLSNRNSSKVNDSEGNKLSEGQQSYFKDSKVVDENGALKVMYHGARGAGFTVFDNSYSDLNDPPKMVHRSTVAGKLFSLSWLKRRADKVARRFDKDDNAPYYFLSNDVFQKLFQLYPASVFSKPIKVPFGKTEAYISPECNTICRMIFGNYEELPPVHMRIPHCGRVYITADVYVFEEPERARIV